MVDLTPDERQYLLDVLRSAHTELLRQIHHSRTRRFAESLRQTVLLNERITARLSGEETESRDPALAGYVVGG
jgi:hypothetical protein